MTRHPLHSLAAAMLALVLAGCGSSAEDSASTAASAAATSEAAAATTSTAASASPASGASSSTVATTADAAVTLIEATVAGGEVTVADDRVEVAQGTDVLIRVTTDAAEPVHLHGYDIEVDAAPGAPAEIAFTADIPGVFEVELEDSGTLLFEVEVK